jgi:hypothetical protein
MEKNNLVYVEIDYDSYTDTTREGDPEAEYDGDDTETSTTVNGVRHVKESGFWDLIVNYPLDRSKNYYLLYVVYSTGDSYNHDEGKVVFIDLYEDVKVADEAAKILEKTYDITEYNYKFPKHVDIPDSKGGINHLYAGPWIGYFSQFTEAVVKKVEVLR